MRVARLLSGRYTCYAMDRRGRAHSGAGTPPYSIEREYEDVCAVLDAAGPGAFLAGHSFGAICAMGAALLHPVPRLVIYEPPFPAGGPIAGEHRMAYARAIAEGDPDTSARDRPEQVHPPERGGHRRHAHHKGVAAPAHAGPKLGPGNGGGRRPPGIVGALSAIACPTLMLSGSLSPEHPLKDASRALAQVLPNVRVEMLMGQGHMALREAPEMVARLIADFLAA